MRSSFSLGVLSLILGAVTGATAIASTASEEQEGARIVRAVDSSQRSCGSLSNTELERVGDYAMGRMLGSTQAHEQMDSLMQRMMGQSATERMHVVMGRRFSRCGGGSTPGGFGGMMGVMGMMGGSGYGGSGSMMGGFRTNGSSGDGDDFGTAGWVMVALMVVLIGLGVAAVALLRPRRSSSSGVPLEVLGARYARGEIDKDEYEQRRNALLGGT
jgi:putative membrane protein